MGQSLKKILEIKNLNKSFNGIKAVNDVSLSIEKGTITSIIGPNGAGKTTLFNLVSGLLKQETGQIIYNSISINNYVQWKRALLGIGRLWQDIRLFSNLTVFENLLVAKKKQPGEQIYKTFFLQSKVTRFEKENIESAEKILSFVDLESKRNSLAKNLSYGQQRLVAIGRLLMNGSSLLLIDEPFAGVNAVMIEKISNLIKELTEQEKTILMIEHNVPKAMSISDFVYVMDAGKIALYGTPEEVTGNNQLKEIYVGV